MKFKILVVDDEKDMRILLKRSLEKELNSKVESAPDGETALELVKRKSFDLALVDIRMPGMGGIELLERIKKIDPGLTVVMMTAYGAIEIAVESIKKGAYDFIKKPFEYEDIIRILNKALERSRLLKENSMLKKRIREKESFHNLIGTSASMQKIYDIIEMTCKTDVTILITGESGTGKNLAAKAIHDRSPRTNKPFIRVSCPTVPENILESELFGYQKGAFTHAQTNKKGLLEEADGGTLYLDEIGDISLVMQTKLLQVIEDKEFKPLGQTRNIKLNVKIIASTNRDLKARMEQDKFRQDLFYRLCVVDIIMPSLKKRKEDIPLLAEFFLTKYCNEFSLKKKQISSGLMRLLLAHNWPGNVRELENLIKKAVVMTPGIKIQADHIGWDEAQKEESLSMQEIDLLPYREAKVKIMEQFNTAYIAKLLTKTGGNVTRAARLCGLERQSLQQVMKKYGVRSDGFRESAKK